MPNQKRICRPSHSRLCEPEYAIGLHNLLQTMIDALDGRGVEELTALFSPFAQATIQRLLNADAEDALTVSRRVARRICEIIEQGHGHTVRRLLSHRKDVAQLELWFAPGGDDE